MTSKMVKGGQKLISQKSDHTWGSQKMTQKMIEIDIDNTTYHEALCIAIIIIVRV